MKKPLFYSLRPAGYNIPASAIIRALKSMGTNANDPILAPIRDFLKIKNVLYLSSGRAALWLILKTLSRMNPGRRQVIIPAYTCPAVASAVLKADLRPVLCDINTVDFGFSISEFQEKIKKDTLAVVLVHLFGYPANIRQLQDCCRAYDVYMIEDAAQGFGNSLLDSPECRLGLLGDAGFFSFGRGKPLSILHGGILAIHSEEVFQIAWQIYKELDPAEENSCLKYLVMLSAYAFFSNPYLYWIPQRIPSLHLGETIFEPDFAITKGLEVAGLVINETVKSSEQDKVIRSKNSYWFARNLNYDSGLEWPPSPEYPYLRYPLIVPNRKMRDHILDNLVSHGTGAALFLSLSFK